MAHRHVVSLFQPIASSSTIKAISRRPAIQKGSLRSASTSAAGAEKEDNAIGSNRSKKDPEDVWNPHPPPLASSWAESSGSEAVEHGRALPVPDNTGTTLHANESDRTAAIGEISDSMSAAVTRGGQASAESEESGSTPTTDESQMPNYPTLPASTSEASPSSTSPKLSIPNTGPSTNESLGSSSHSHATSASSHISSPSPPSSPQPFDFTSLSASLKATSQKIRTSIPPEVQAKILEWSASVSSHSKRVAKDTEKRLVELGLKVNQMTGYQEVERLKGLVFAKEDNLQSLREAARAAKEAYDQAVAARSSAQRDVNSLLERKHSWTDADVSRFTSLVRADHASTHAVSSTSIALKEAELAVDKAFSELMQTILQRYHEEQVWSDKIRSVSTWANLIGLALNAVIFLGAVVFVEPWKRRRLVERLEERVAGMMERVEGRLGGLEGNLREFAIGSQAAAASTNAPFAGVMPASIGTVDPVPVIEEEAELLPLLDAETNLSQPPPSDNINVTPSAQQLSSNADTAQVPPELASPPLDSITPPLATATLLYPPLLTKTINDLPPYLDPLAKPSQERDLVIAGLAGAAIMGVIMSIGRALFS
ncbi:hypothetical protein I317_02101 [Kwoniella heveanensis CBS 569]|nr:hypothetical protein I317_02101 [Kwoniella heveanensis CBS 569]